MNTLADLRDKVAAGEPLSFEDGVRLYESPDIFTLGELANSVRQRLHGRSAFYNINLHVNYTNYCVLRCKFCSFYRPYPKGRFQNRAASVRERGNETAREGIETASERAAARALRESSGVEKSADSGFISSAESPGQAAAFDDGYELSIDEVVSRARQAYARGATEVHIVGGLHPKLPFDYYVDMCRAIHDACPHMHIKAFTAIEIIHFTRIARPRLSIAEVLTRLRDAGLSSLPGGGAEIFDERVHDEAYKTKVGEAEWFEVHRTAHELGMFTNATMLYGHIETPAERIRHLIKLREHQAESLRSRSAHFHCIIPLSFIPDGSALGHLSGPDGLDDLKTLALARLMCPNIPHIKAFWIMQTPKLAQVSLNWGVDDIDGTVVYYDITKREGNGTHQELTVDKLKRLIVEAGCTPVERDTLYRRVLRDDASWWVEGEPWRVPFRADSLGEQPGAHGAMVELSISR